MQLPGGSGGRRIAVRTELVREFLLERVLAEVDRRSSEPPPEHIRAALDAVADRVGDAPAKSTRALARHGYVTRVVETELFEPARAAMPWLGDLVRARVETGASHLDAIIEVSGELARREPVERPDPDDELSASWRVPGPGGHIRHYLALHAARREAGSRPERELGLALKRSWMYGFYLRCGEESLPPERAP